MVERFKRYIAEKQLINSSDQVLVAVSGGIDSVVLCHLLYLSQINFSMAHCNFSLRGKDSDEDENFVKELARSFKINLYTTRFNTKTYAEEKKISIQMAARELRYEWFKEILTNNNVNLLATAHHSNDNLETILLNLVRGTGIAGFHGIKPKTGNIIRPLLFANKEEIEAFAQQNNLLWREDSSNQSTKYYRNLVRKEVVPILKKINPILEETTLVTTEKITAVENFLSSEVERLKKEVVKEKEGIIYINCHFLKENPQKVILLNEIIKDYHFSWFDTKNIISALNEPGKKFLSETFILTIDRERLLISRKESTIYKKIVIHPADSKIYFQGKALNIKILPSSNFKINTDPLQAGLDISRLNFPLVLRKWESGDWFMPLGMKNKKKLSDFFIDQKIPVPEKENIWVLTSDNNIVWIVGHRIDNRFKITDKTNQVFHLKIE